MVMLFGNVSHMRSQAFLPVQNPSVLLHRLRSASLGSARCSHNATRPRMRRNVQTATMTAKPAAGAASSAKNSLIDTLLHTAEGTNCGAESSTTERENIINMIEQLLASSGPPPSFTNPRLYDCFSVLYSVTPQSSKQKSPAVGGYLRSPLGRRLFRTTGLYQHLIQPNIIVNLLCFRLLGFINGMVTLYGTISTDENDTRYVIATFESPRTRLGPALFQYGPTSSVELQVCYIDDRIRIDRGKRGTYIVFTRRPSSDSWPEADAWKDLLDVKPLPTFILPLLLLSVAVVSFRAPLVIRIFVISFVIAIARVLTRGRTVPKFTINQRSGETSAES